MSQHWIIYIIIAVVATLLYRVCGKFKFLKSNPSRIFVVILVSSIICWLIYDFVIATE